MAYSDLYVRLITRGPLVILSEINVDPKISDSNALYFNTGALASQHIITIGIHLCGVTTSYIKAMYIQ